MHIFLHFLNHKPGTCAYCNYQWLKNHNCEEIFWIFLVYAELLVSTPHKLRRLSGLKDGSLLFISYSLFHSGLLRLSSLFFWSWTFLQVLQNFRSREISKDWVFILSFLGLNNWFSHKSLLVHRLIFYFTTWRQLRFKLFCEITLRFNWEKTAQWKNRQHEHNGTFLLWKWGS